MGRARKATFPKVSIHKGRVRARLRFGQRDIWLGKAGSREAENNRLCVHAAWVEAGGKLPDDFTLVEDSPVIPIPTRKPPTLLVTSGLIVGDLLAEALQEVGGGKTKAKGRGLPCPPTPDHLPTSTGKPCQSHHPRRWLGHTTYETKTGLEALDIRAYIRSIGTPQPLRS